MADTGRADPFSDIISLVAGPIAAVIKSFDQLRRGADELMKGLENFNRTMTNLNDTAERVNSLLADIEEPVRAVLPQVVKTVQFADEFSTRLSAPLEQVIPGILRLSETLNSPVISSLPTDLNGFVDSINDLVRRLSPLGQLAESAGGLFGLRIPGLSRPGAPAAPVASPPRTGDDGGEPSRVNAAARTAAAKAGPRKSSPKKKAAATTSSATTSARKPAARKSAATKSAARRKSGAR